jgi:SAM-dependent methyltransferase
LTRAVVWGWFSMPVSHSIMHFLARYSEGLRLTEEHGPKSGIVFEYAFRNEPQGHGAVGRLIDRAFLSLPAWDSARQRIETTKETVAQLVAQRRSAGQTTMILDVASGTARYLRAIAREAGSDDLIIACHDRDPRAVMLGRQLIAAEGLRRFTFSVGDATDHSSYLTSRDPDIVLAVGLFDNLHRDDAVRTVIRLALTHLTPGGAFLCTTLTKAQTALHHWDGNGFGARPAVRAPETIAGWLRAAGFVRVDQRFSHPQGFALIGVKPEA